MELRYEHKYYVPKCKEAELRKMVSSFVCHDKYAIDRVNNEYTVRSIYFDTPGFQYYHDKVDGLAYRKKVRLRGYNQFNCENPVFLEVKNKHEIPLHKTRALTVYENTLDSFEKGDLRAILNQITNNHAEANSFIYQILSKNLRPVILVIYEREAYTEKINTSNRLRITFDKNLRSTEFPKISELYFEKEIVNSLPGYFILEVKFNKFYPTWMKSIIAALNLRQESASKYVIAMDSHDIVNKYSRYKVLEKKII